MNEEAMEESLEGKKFWKLYIYIGLQGRGKKESKQKRISKYKKRLYIHKNKKSINIG